jgi:hypothetical protein
MPSILQTGESSSDTLHIRIIRLPTLVKHKRHRIAATGDATTQNTQNLLEPAEYFPFMEKMAATKDKGTKMVR